jgi:hypothetical protein
LTVAAGFATADPREKPLGQARLAATNSLKIGSRGGRTDLIVIRRKTKRRNGPSV